MSLMKEASEHGAPAYLLTVRGSVHISQSDFSIMYRHVTSFFMKATVHPQRAIDLNISTSLEFLRLVTPSTGGGKSIIDRCMTDEKILETPLLEEMPDEHRPDDEWIAAKLRVDHAFRTRVAAGVQRKLKRNPKDGLVAGYTTADEMWCHYKPTEEELRKWIVQEDRGEKRIDEDHALNGEGDDDGGKDGDEDKSISRPSSRSDADNGSAIQSKQGPASQQVLQSHHPKSFEHVHDKFERNEGSANVPGAAAADSASNDPPPKTWLGVLPALKDGPQQD